MESSLQEEWPGRNDAIDVFLRLFFARRDAYGRQTAHGVITEKKPVTSALIQAHLAGLERIGAHSTNVENSCRYGCVDIDHDEPDLSDEERSMLSALGPARVRKGRGLDILLLHEVAERQRARDCQQGSRSAKACALSASVRRLPRGARRPIWPTTRRSPAPRSGSCAACQKIESVISNAVAVLRAPNKTCCS